MVGSTKHKTLSDTQRFRALHDIGCIVTFVYFGVMGTPGDIHHLLDVGGHRFQDEHQMTICLTPWYHRGIRPTNRYGRMLTYVECERSFGPSLVWDKIAFEKRFGNEFELLEMTNQCLATMAAA